MRVLVVTIAPIYWALSGEGGEALNGQSLTGGSFRQESHVEFDTGEQGPFQVGRVGLWAGPRACPRGDPGLPAGERLTMTQVARGLDPAGLLLLDVVINGVVPADLADEELHMQVGAGPECGWGLVWAGPECGGLGVGGLCGNRDSFPATAQQQGPD